MSDESMSYIGRKPCGCVVAAISDEPIMRSAVSKEVSAWIMQGLTIERVTHEYVREHFIIDCPHHEGQLELF